jgi:hypothetical protein
VTPVGQQAPFHYHWDAGGFAVPGHAEYLQHRDSETPPSWTSPPGSPPAPPTPPTPLQPQPPQQEPPEDIAAEEAAVEDPAAEVGWPEWSVAFTIDDKSATEEPHG